jgi:hypothetical protein
MVRMKAGHQIRHNYASTADDNISGSYTTC